LAKCDFLRTFHPTFSIINAFRLLRSLKDYGEQSFLSETYFGQASQPGIGRAPGNVDLSYNLPDGFLLVSSAVFS
jgi:hypothetical protein